MGPHVHDWHRYGHVWHGPRGSYPGTYGMLFAVCTNVILLRARAVLMLGLLPRCSWLQHATCMTVCKCVKPWGIPGFAQHVGMSRGTILTDNSCEKSYKPWLAQTWCFLHSACSSAPALAAVSCMLA